jgi:hypothetical protein
MQIRSEGTSAEVSDIQTAFSVKGFTIARPPNLRPCCKSSVNSVSQPVSIAAATISAS